MGCALEIWETAQAEVVFGEDVAACASLLAWKEASGPQVKLPVALPGVWVWTGQPYFSAFHPGNKLEGKKINADI
jgi:hypothetical protein